MKEYRYYLLHSFLRNFTQYAFFIFGSLLIYEKTHSLGITLLYYLLGSVASVVTKSLFVEGYLRLAKRIGTIRTMAGTMLIGAGSLIGVFFIHAGNFAIASLMVFSIIYSIANSCYWILSNAVYLNYAGKSDTPGKLTAYNFIATLMAATTVSLVTFFLHLDHNFLLLLILMGIFLLVSILPLRFLDFPDVEPVSFRECLRGISVLGFWSNVNPEQTIVTLGIPLVTLSLFGSLGISINISVIVAIVTMVLIYGAGTSKDKNSNRILWPALVIACLSTIAYAFIKTQEAFIVIGIVYSTSYSIVDAVREARLSREVSNGANAVQTTVAIEFARSLASLIGGTLLMAGYLIFHAIWQPLLVLGIAFIIPRAFYTLRNIGTAILSS